jgi:hypothetical protein
MVVYNVTVNQQVLGLPQDFTDYKIEVIAVYIVTKFEETEKEWRKQNLLKQ